MILDLSHDSYLLYLTVYFSLDFCTSLKIHTNKRRASQATWPNGCLQETVALQRCYSSSCII